MVGDTADLQHALVSWEFVLICIEYAKSVTIWTNRFPAGIGNRAFFAFSGTMTRDRGFIALRTHWVDLADY